MLKEIKNAFVCFLILTAITGIAYPFAVTAIAHIAFTNQADGSLRQDNKGSTLIGQNFDDTKYFWGRLSGCGYNAASSSGTNYAMSNSALLDAAKARIDALKQADPENNLPIPVDLVTASGSGLDPHISVAAAAYQADRVARARGIDVAIVKQLISEHTEGGVLSSAYVNVLSLNAALNAR